MAILDDNFDFEQDGKVYNIYNLPDGFVLKGYVDLSQKNLTELPDLSRVTVDGDFDCSENRLTSLKGAPQKVTGDFRCDHNQLTFLKGAPQKVGGYFWCQHNQLTTLEGAPQEVGGDFCCYGDSLSSLFGISKVGGEIKGSYLLIKEYDCRKSPDYGIYYADLVASAKYQSELSANKIRQKHEKWVKKDADTKAKHRAGYAAFKKKQAKERE